MTVLMHRQRYLLPDNTPLIAMFRAGRERPEWWLEAPSGERLYLVDVDGRTLCRVVSEQPLELEPSDMQVSDLRIDTEPHPRQEGRDS